MHLISPPHPPGQKAALAAATSPRLSISSASQRSSDQSRPSPIAVGSGCQLHDTPPTHPAGETLCIHQASPERHTAIWKAQRCQTANVLGKRRQRILQTPQRIRGRTREERPGRNYTKNRGREPALGKFTEEWHCLFSYFKKGDTAEADSTALRRCQEGLPFFLSCPVLQY